MLFGPCEAEREGLTPLMVAAQKGDTATMMVLIENGADVNEIDAMGQTALMHALLMG